MIATCSEEIALLQYHDGQEIRVKFPARLVSQKGGTKDASTDEMKNADLTGLTESAMSIAREGTHHSLVSRTAHPTIRWRVEPHIRRQHHT